RCDARLGSVNNRLNTGSLSEYSTWPRPRRICLQSRRSRRSWVNPNEKATTTNEGKSVRSLRVGSARGVCGVARLGGGINHHRRRAPSLTPLDAPAPPGIAHEVRVVSAHRTPDLLFEYAAGARARGLKAIIAGAGGAAHLPGMTAAKTSLPVLGVPVQAKALHGMDSLLSIVQR